MNEPITRGWHLDKRVSVGHIVTTMLALVAAVIAYAELKGRVDVNERALMELAQRIDRSESRNDRQFQEIKDLLQRIDDKLDDKVDK